MTRFALVASQLLVGGAHTRLRNMLARAGLVDRIGHDRFFTTVDLAVQSAMAQKPASPPPSTVNASRAPADPHAPSAS